MVSPLFEHVVHIRYPKSLYFIGDKRIFQAFRFIQLFFSGLNLVAITFPLFECQVRMALAFALGKTELPSQRELENFEDEWME